MAKTESKKANVSFENFDLLKVKVLDKKVDIQYFNLENPNRIERSEGKDLPHPKLLEALSNFNEIFAKQSGHLDGWDFARDNIKANLEATKIARDSYTECVDNHNVTGVSYIGDKSKGIQLSGSFKPLNGGSFGYAAPKIYFESDTISFGEEARDLAEKLKERVYAYVFKNEFGTPKPKKGTEIDENQTSLLDEDQKQN